MTTTTQRLSQVKQINGELNWHIDYVSLVPPGTEFFKIGQAGEAWYSSTRNGLDKSFILNATQPHSTPELIPMIQNVHWGLEADTTGFKIRPPNRHCFLRSLYIQ